MSLYRTSGGSASVKKYTGITPKTADGQYATYDITALTDKYADLVYGETLMVQTDTLGSVSNRVTMTYTYDASTGVLTAHSAPLSGSDYTRIQSATIYIIA